MRDLIDERNAREKIKSSIIKRANVHYMTPEELARIKEEEDKKKAQEIYERLQAEAKEDEEKKAEERRQAMEQRHLSRHPLPVQWLFRNNAFAQIGF